MTRIADIRAEAFETGARSMVGRSTALPGAAAPFPAMSDIQRQIEAIFTSGRTAGEEQSGDGWRIQSVQRDLALWHSVSCGPFECALRGVGAVDGRSLTVHVIVLRSGMLDVRQWGRFRSLTSGDIFVCCGWLPLTLHADREVDALICELPAWWAIERFLDNSLVRPDLHIDHSFFAAPIIGQMAETIYTLRDPGDPAAQGMEMIADLLRTGLAAGIDDGKPMPRVVGRMGRILQFMIRHIDQTGLSAHDAAAELKCSPRTIYKTCSDHGTTFNAILMDVRLLTAQHHLLRSEDRVSQIAYAVGFSSLSHFSRQFKARFGAPAKTYRRLRRRPEQGLFAP